MNNEYLSFTDIVDTNNEIKDLINSFGENKYEILLKTLEWFKTNIRSRKYENPSQQMEEWRKRKATEIFESKKVSGCTDEAILFISFMRTAGISCSYIETVNIYDVDSALRSSMNKAPDGHVFCRVEIDGIRIIVDPTFQQLFFRNSVTQKVMVTENLLLDEGVDFQDLHVSTLEELMERTVEKFGK